MQKFSIIIPTLNEADNILLLLNRISHIFQPLDIEPEILIVDDGSTDGTRESVASYRGRFSVRLICRDSVRGLASAVVAGARQASQEYIVVMDADLSHPPELIPQLIEPLLAGTHDMVIGSRYVAGGSTPNWPVVRRIGSQIASIPARMFTSAHDPLSGFFSISRDRLRNLDDKLAGFKIGLEILAGSGRSLRVLEVPLVFKDRSHGQSKMNLRVFREYLCQLGRLSCIHHFVRTVPMLLFLGLSAGMADYALFTSLVKHGWGVESSHLLSFLAAVHSCYLLSLLFGWQKQPGAIAGNYLRFLIIVLLGFFLRGGLLAMPFPSHGAPHILLPITFAVTDFLIWMTAITFDRIDVLARHTMNWRSFGIFLIGYTVLLRLFYLGNIELIQEEAYYWNYSRHLAAGYLDHPPVIALLIRFGTELFGNNEFGVRIGAFICWSITGFFTYRLSKTIFNSAVAFRALILVATLPIFFGVGLFSTPDAPLVACWAGTIYFFHRALILQESQAWYWAGISLGIGLASKYTIVFLGPAIILYMFTEPSARKWFFRPQPYLAAFLTFAVFSPVLWWNYEHNWASFLFQSQKRLVAASHFSTPMLLISILILLTPTGFCSAITSMLPKVAASRTPNKIDGSEIRSAYLFCLTMVLVPLSIFILFSFTKEIKLNWTGPLWLSILPFIAYGMVRGESRLQHWVAMLWPGTLLVSLFTYAAVLFYCAFGLPATPFANNVFLFGWNDLAQQVEILSHRAANRQPLLVVGMDKYRTASGLAFYLNKNSPAGRVNSEVTKATGWQLFGYDSLMYNYWYPPALAKSRDILVISKDKKLLDPALFANHYHLLGQMKELNVSKRGKSAGHFFYRVLRSYINTTGTT